MVATKGKVGTTINIEDVCEQEQLLVMEHAAQPFDLLLGRTLLDRPGYRQQLPGTVSSHDVF